MYIAYTDGCTGDCETNPNAAVAGQPPFQGRYLSIASVLRQDTGQLLFSQAKHKQ